MKTILTFFLFITCSITIAQNDFKPLDSLTSWQVRSVFVTGGSGWTGWKHIFTDSVLNDTLVGGN